MIVFNNVTVKNFLSYGNVPTSLRLDSHKNTLITGSNGTGKSSLVTDAISYALYGKPYRSIKLGQLANSINQKAMEVAIEFTIGTTKYKVRRGVKPTVFEIYKDNVIVPREAEDYQKYLEKSVLKINHKTFCQVVILGTASFVPFMKLGTPQRRDVIEDVLDISIFSDMNSILKSKMSITKEELTLTNVEIENVKKETLAQQKLIKVLEEAKGNRIKEEEDSIKELVLEMKSQDSKRKAIKVDIENLSKSRPEKIEQTEINSAERIKSRLEDELTRLEKRVSSVSKLENCPTCLQEVTSEHKHSIKTESDEQILVIKEELKSAEIVLDSIRDKVRAYDTICDEITSLTNDYNDTSAEIQRLMKSIDKHKSVIDSLNAETTDIASEKETLKEIADKALSLIKKKTELTKQKEIQDVSLLLLKDSGIKAAIIREYVPILNKLINKYLTVFGFSINYTLDEEFNEKILSRGRDEFSYNSFSEGEKRRIDLAILFAFRQITEMKNSANTNLLVMDEIGQENFDDAAKEALTNLLDIMVGSNTVVVSHSATIDPGTFDRTFLVYKKNEFSVMEQN